MLTEKGMLWAIGAAKESKVARVALMGSECGWPAEFVEVAETVCNTEGAKSPSRPPGTVTQVSLVIDFTEPVYPDALTDGLGEWMRMLEVGDGFAKLGIRDWHFEKDGEVV